MEEFKDEVMNDDELDNVAGGNFYEIHRDSYFLNALNGSCKRYDAEDFIKSSNDVVIEMIKAWSTVGVSVLLDAGDNTPNRYFINGEEVSQHQAYEHAREYQRAINVSRKSNDAT